MTVTMMLLQRLLPLYIIIVFGYVAGKYLHVQKESIARLLIYVVTPTAMFYNVATTPLSASIFSLAAIFFGCCCIICLVFFWLSSFFWQDSTKNLLAFSAGTANSGYFGLPVVAALFGEQATRLVFIAILGFILFECLLGMYIVARGAYGVKESMLRVLKIPAIYAFSAGLLVNALGFQFDVGLAATFEGFTATFSVLGMMLVGLSIADLKAYVWDISFLLFAFLAKFLVWPLLMLTIVFLDNTFWHFYTTQIHHVMIILAVTPLAVKTVAYATELRVQPEKAALATLISTFLALISMPLVVVVFQM